MSSPAHFSDIEHTAVSSTSGSLSSSHPTSAPSQTSAGSPGGSSRTSVTAQSSSSGATRRARERVGMRHPRRRLFGSDTSDSTTPLQHAGNVLSNNDFALPPVHAAGSQRRLTTTLGSQSDQHIVARREARLRNYRERLFLAEYHVARQERWCKTDEERTREQEDKEDQEELDEIMGWSRASSSYEEELMRSLEWDS
ncbi:hypothetical protein LTR37_000069 [Vermiconidia calcicola]|uniref:Uncharacterized protein n=1 Tax=Vermiconidia calcicola TaxID=1690605 RepID=A0ACC3NZG3_9PEZI|nr:hypothetical protein LTR37_000069 [Vermiconidia calcicola]